MEGIQGRKDGQATPQHPAWPCSWSLFPGSVPCSAVRDPLSRCCSASTEVFCDCSEAPALGPARAPQSHRPRCPRQLLALGPGNIPWQCSPTRTGAQSTSPPHLPPPGGRERGVSQTQTGHMDNHLRLIARLCRGDGPQTSGSDKPRLSPCSCLKRSTKCCRKIQAVGIGVAARQ